MPIEISNASSRLSVVYRQRSSWGLYVFAAGSLLWLVSFSQNVPREFRDPRGISDFVSIALFVLFALATILFLCFRLAGSTRLEFSDNELIVTHQLFGVHFIQSALLLADLPEPHFVEEDHEVGSRSKTPSCIRFDFPDGEFTCCSHIAGDEAYELIERIRETFPELAKRWGTGAHQHSKDILSLNLS